MRRVASPARRRTCGGLLCAVSATLILKALIALLTVGTNDSLTWEHDLAKLRVAGAVQLYRDGVQYSSPSGRPYPRQDFIHPPPVVNALYVLGNLRDASGLPLRFWLRFACAVADVGTLVLVARRFPKPRDEKLLVLLALSPVSLLLSGFHGNTDSIMVFFTVASVLLVECGDTAKAGGVFGIAISIKLVPMIFAPAILFYLPDLRLRIKWVCLAATTWCLLSMPYLARDPILILRRLLGYQSAQGLWGLEFVFRLLEGGGGPAHQTFYASLGKWVALAAGAAVPLVLRSLGRGVSLFVQCGLVGFLFLFLSPGFGLQYLAWTVPWTLVLGFEGMLLYHAVVGTCILTVYIDACRGMGPGIYADLLTRNHFTMLACMGLVCWLAIGVVLWRYAKLVSASALQFRLAATEDDLGSV